MPHKKVLLFTLSFLLFTLLTGCGNIQFVKPAVNCEYEGATYVPGTGSIPATDGCNTCFCDKDGEIACTEKACLDEEDEVGLANPAAVKCAEDGFIYEIRDNEDDSQTGYCIDEADNECDEWEYFRGECLLGEITQQFEAELKTTNDSEALGSAKTSYSADEFKLEVSARNLPELSEDSAYEVFLVQVEPLDKMLVGELTFEEVEGAYILSLESPEDFTVYERVTVELDDEVLLEGSFQPIDSES